MIMAFSTFLASASMAAAADDPGGHTGTKQSSRLYTEPDPSAAGGLTFRPTSPSGDLVAAFAVPQLQVKAVYKAEIENDTVRFRGLPAAKYDVLVLCKNGFYEGFRLTRDEDTLTPEDRKSIEAAIRRAVQFFDTKEIHRLEGFTGQAGQATSVLQELRTKPVTLQDASVRSDIQIRSLKLVYLEDVGAVGWQLLTTRELVRTEVAGHERRGLLPHRFCPALGGVRVTDAVRDLGEVDLAKK